MRPKDAFLNASQELLTFFLRHKLNIKNVKHHWKSHVNTSFLLSIGKWAIQGFDGTISENLDNLVRFRNPTIRIRTIRGSPVLVKPCIQHFLSSQEELNQLNFVVDRPVFRYHVQNLESKFAADRLQNPS